MSQHKDDNIRAAFMAGYEAGEDHAAAWERGAGTEETAESEFRRWLATRPPRPEGEGMSDPWTRWQMGETIEALAKEHGVTRGRMRYRLENLAKGRQAVQMYEALRLISISDNLDLYPADAHARCVRIAKAALSPQPPEDAR